MEFLQDLGRAIARFHIAGMISTSLPDAGIFTPDRPIDRQHYNQTYMGNC
jgi:hypothetical protein